MDGIAKEVEDRLARGDEDAAAEVLEKTIGQVKGASLRSLIEAARSIDRNDIAIALADGLAANRQRNLYILNLRGEAGEAIADELAALVGPGSVDPAETLQLAGAYEMENRYAEAICALERGIAADPAWIAGQQNLAQLRWMAGEQDAARDFALACLKLPTEELLRAAWLGTLKSMQDWAKLEPALEAARRDFPDSILIPMLAAEGLSEMGRRDAADAGFAAVSHVADPQFDAARMRHQMRADRPLEAARIGARALATHRNPECLAWLGASLRALDDPRADWFYRGEQLLATFAIDLDEDWRTELAGTLRAIHRGSAPPLGQSPRGGTQTLGPLLKRREPPIVKLRAALRAAVRSYVDALPPPEPEHFFLGQSREAFRFEGSWSIRLKPQGHHVPHIHSRGWISSALYIDLPSGMDRAEDRQGWLQIGQPPLDGGKPVAPLALVAPVPLKLALFPSLFWHGTLPFGEGERLTVAFDVVPR